MNKLTTLSIFVFTIATLSARDLSATKSCEAFNNLKHTKNSGHVVLEPNHSYTIVREQKGNYFIKVDGAKPTMRWVSRDCFGNGSNYKSEVSSLDINNNKTQITKKEKNSRENNKIIRNNDNNSNLDSVLVLSWHNSFCETHSNKKECKREGGDAKNHLVLHGLWPQPRSNEYCGVDNKIKDLDKSKRWYALPSLNLNNNIKTLMTKYMPGSQSNLQRHEYYKHGSCYSSDANIYFKDALVMTQKLDNTIGKYLRANLGKKINLYTLRKVANRLLGKDIANKIALKCKRRVLSEIWIPIRGKGSDIAKLVSGAKSVRSNCQEAIVDKPGKFRR